MVHRTCFPDVVTWIYCETDFHQLKAIIMVKITKQQLNYSTHIYHRIGRHGRHHLQTVVVNDSVNDDQNCVACFVILTGSCYAIDDIYHETCFSSDDYRKVRVALNPMVRLEPGCAIDCWYIIEIISVSSNQFMAYRKFPNLSNTTGPDFTGGAGAGAWFCVCCSARPNIPTGVGNFRLGASGWCWCDCWDPNWLSGFPKRFKPLSPVGWSLMPLEIFSATPWDCCCICGRCKVPLAVIVGLKVSSFGNIIFHFAGGWSLEVGALVSDCCWSLLLENLLEFWDLCACCCCCWSERTVCDFVGVELFPAFEASADLAPYNSDSFAPKSSRTGRFSKILKK